MEEEVREQGAGEKEEGRPNDGSLS